MKIALTDTVGDLRYPGRNGFSDIVWSLGSELARCGHDVHIVGLYPTRFELATDEISVTAVHPSERTNIATILSDAWRVEREVERSHPDVAHVMDCVTAGVICLSPLHRRTVYHGHMNVREHRRRAAVNPWSPSMYVAMRVGSVIACRRCARLISLGRSQSRGWMALGASPEKIAIIPNGIHCGQGYDPRSTGATVLYVGRMSPEKGGIIELVRALAFLPSPIRLVIAGSGPLEPDARQIAHELGVADRISFVGFLDPKGVSQLYCSGDLVVLPSINETMPRVMLEAWRAGVPFAATPVGAIPDYLTDGYNGYLIAEPTVGAIAATIRRAMDNPEERARIAATARKEVECFSWPNIAQELVEKVYQPIIDTVGRNKRARVSQRAPV